MDKDIDQNNHRIDLEKITEEEGIPLNINIKKDKNIIINLQNMTVTRSKTKRKSKIQENPLFETIPITAEERSMEENADTLKDIDNLIDDNDLDDNNSNNRMLHIQKNNDDLESIFGPDTPPHSPVPPLTPPKSISTYYYT